MNFIWTLVCLSAGFLFAVAWLSPDPHERRCNAPVHFYYYEVKPHNEPRQRPEQTYRKEVRGTMEERFIGGTTT